jgi:urate oxidase
MVIAVYVHYNKICRKTSMENFVNVVSDHFVDRYIYKGLCVRLHSYCWRSTYWIDIRKEEYEDTKWVIRIRKSKKDRETTQWPKQKGQKDKQRSR